MDDLAARREARRRKILENSESRLKKITSVECRTTTSELDGKSFTEARERSLTAEHSSNIEGNDLGGLLESQSTEKHLETIFQNPRVFSDDDSISQVPPIAVKKNFQRLYIIILPLLTNLVFILFDLLNIQKDFMNLNKIFLPLIGYKIYEFIFLSSNIDFTNSFISSIIVLSNRRYLRRMNKIISYCVVFIQDVMIYFFVFMLCQFSIRVIFYIF
ncbi:unnamed protein product [Phyllotreta striolata]|uniref:Uncharacterized protein n=1 Tax=Phyllotreta striolata TaxID=444603 RepID=A0A9N9TE66_PHYSR|nr:unnamed protein product [Phyllotreta striolata]